MAKARGVDAVMEALAALKSQPASPEVGGQIGKALDSKVNFVVAKAADLARQFKFGELCPQLTAAFDRFMAEDKGCAAKTAIAKAALELECGAEAVFVAGVRHVQMEGSFGGPVDVAAELRGLCALGLVQVRYRGMMNELVELLADREPQARTGAVRALANTGREDAALALRLKVLLGDREPDVMGECFSALLHIAPVESVSFVGRFLESPEDAVRDAAALALGASRQPASLELLKRLYVPGIDPRFRPTLFLAIATCRSPEAIEFLTSLVGEERPGAAAEAVAALGLYRHDAALRGRVAKAVKDVGSDMLAREFVKHFGPDA